MRKLLYLAYHIKELDWKKIRRFAKVASKECGAPAGLLLWRSFFASYRCLISPIEFFLFRFYQLPKAEWSKWAGTSYMYEYQLEMNPRSSRGVLADKTTFLSVYAPFVKHLFLSLEELKAQPEKANRLLEASDKIVFKASDGQCGRGIEILATQNLTSDLVLSTLEMGGNDLVEQFVEQHPDLQSLSPSGLNTLRVITQIRKDGGVDLLAARLRITIDSPVDNMAAGNAAASVNLNDGRVDRPAVFSDLEKDPVAVHPITSTPIVGFQVPYFKESLALATAAAKHRPENKSVGWDIAITKDGPELIEGNHDWCKLLWQLPVNEGLKGDLEKYKQTEQEE